MTIRHFPHTLAGKLLEDGIPMSYRDELLSLLMEKSFQKGEFTLASGMKSDYYINGKLTTLNSRGAYLAARIFLAMIGDDVPDAVGGLTIGADPIIGSMLALAGMEDLPLKGFIVRKAAKEHGTQSLVEGDLSEGDRVVVIEDVITTGGSSLKAIEAVKSLGCEVTRVLVIVDRQQGAQENLKKNGYRLESIFSIEELLRLG
ncbi:MAG: orotate phosphoribosyltransferase [Candidatus Latescibacteria bacterium]|nr:orotate phosphoribosyltransferase [Candidatus Latescibacterota bacterium]NIM22509.1 orotate phosphoribosyltransferase [Candidatus Latescibacterota bacterium]NIM64823.1 orotate phosphoribosyltransferase [Candidatus Latescibacterota bacterium]NIO01331.1 orotate phosphoribosyltransferase [Candidatus Latescibacterota bacterium]NIO27820.1 orotate phosphoribosyltransferase [Candidatus Latescibacterota bacterium]